MSKLVEKMARAIADEGVGCGWDKLYERCVSDFDREDMREYARASIIALHEWLKENNLQIVGKTPTPGMCTAVNAACDAPDADLGWTWGCWLENAPDPLADEEGQS